MSRLIASDRASYSTLACLSEADITQLVARLCGEYFVDRAPAPSGADSRIETLSAELVAVRNALTRMPELLAIHVQESIVAATSDLSDRFLTLHRLMDTELGGRVAALEALAKGPSIASPASPDNWADSRGSSGNDGIDWV